MFKQIGVQVTNQFQAPKKSKLNPKQQLFVKEYLKDLNAKQACIRVYNLTPNQAKTRGSRLLAMDYVAEAIAKEFEQRTKKVEVDVEFVLRELLQIANCDIAEAFTEEGGLKDIHNIPLPIRKTISSFEVEEIWEFTREGKKRTKEQIGELKKVKFWDKKGSLELLGKYLAMFVERQQHESPGGVPLSPPQIIIVKHGSPVPEAAIPATVSEQVNRVEEAVAS